MAECRKVEIEVQEMTNADAHFISLVKRGAMRVPFRILKSEEKGMINLTRLWTQKGEEVDAPTMVAMVVPTGSNIDDLKESLEELGHKVVKTETREDAQSEMLIFKDDFDAEEILTFKMSENVGVVMENVKKYFTPYGAEGTDFMTNIQAQGFYPGMHMAMDCLCTTVMNALDEGENGNAPTELINKAVDEFATYVKDLASKIPSIAFKAETLVKKAEAETTEEVVKEESTEESTEEVAKSEEDEAGDTETVAKEESEGDADAADTEQVAKSEDDDLLDTAVTTVKEDAKSETATKSDESSDSETEVATKDESDTDEAETAVKEEVTEETQETATKTEEAAALSVEDALDEKLQSFMAGLQTKITESIGAELKTIATKVDEVATKVDDALAKVDTVTKEVESVKEDVKKAEAAVEEAHQKVAKAEATVAGTLLDGGSTEDRLPIETPVRKQDQSTGTFDTAFTFPGLEN